jgi:phenylacetate-CoA ligase
MIDSALQILQMRHNQWKPREKIEELQEKRLISLVSQAAQKVPHYKKTLSPIRSIDDLPGLPIIGKNDIREPDSFIRDGYVKGDLLKFRTSGSTGLALETYATPQERAYRLALYRFRFLESGFHPLDLMARVVYKPSDTVFTGGFGLFRTSFISLFQEDLKILEGLAKLKPDVLRSYPGTLAILAKANLETGIQIPKVFSSAAVLSENARKLIGSSFGADVRNIYGAVETGPIAFECEKGSLHLFSDSVIAEVVDEAGQVLSPGKTGSLVLTPLWLRAMPLIRYNLADRVSLGPKCPCGRGSHTIKSVVGRVDPLIVLQSGKLASCVAFDIYVRTFPGVVAFQALQEEPGKCVLSIVPDKNFKNEALLKLKSKLESTFPERFTVEPRIVDSISPDSSGKIPAVVSKIMRGF